MPETEQVTILKDEPLIVARHGAIDFRNIPRCHCTHDSAAYREVVKAITLYFERVKGVVGA